MPVSPGMYKSLYKRDYQWYQEHEPPNREDAEELPIAASQLKAQDFAIPQEEQAMTYSDSIVRERREVIPAPSIKASSCADDAGGRKSEDSTSSPKALHQREHFTSVPPVPESDLLKYHPATQLAATQAEKSGRLQALAEPENKLFHCQHLPAASQTAETAGMLLSRQNPALGWATYKQFLLEMCQAREQDTQQNRSMNLGSSVLVEEGSDPDWRSTYNMDFQRWTEAQGGYCRTNTNLSHIFPEDELLNQNRWVSEYKDNYSIFLRRLNRSSHPPAAGLCSGLSSGTGAAMDTAQ